MDQNSRIGPYGMQGLLAFLQHLPLDPSIGALALGYDLTSLGLNLNSSKRSLYETFGGPWMEYKCRSQDVEVEVPDEYRTNVSIREKLPNIELKNLADDVLFFLFYNCPNEVHQLEAASELYRRDWRFHKVDQVWITRFFAIKSGEATGSREKSTFNVFDPKQWKKITKDINLQYKELEGRPIVAEEKHNF
uniref:NOT2/NOT3/NOT5 C-terminal domain-containing protein n=1 Tax=Ditylenchus dipsaci TaxID=166011 RepID=A0A915D6S2_9BILA